MNYDSITEINQVLSRMNLGLKKRWGQNFMVSRSAREGIVGLLGLKGGEKVWEIGPGMGALTELLLKSCPDLTVFEIDAGLIRFLTEEFGYDYPGLKIVQGDMVKTWKGEFEQGGTPDRVTGNLPYSSASILIGKFAEQGFAPFKMVYTVQKELAERMTSKPGGENYSSFSILCQFAFKTVRRSDLKPGCFYPVPQVTSAVIEMTPAARASAPADRGAFLEIVRSSFVMRRKTLRNNLSACPIVKKTGMDRLMDSLRSAGFKESVRGEELSVDDFIALSNALSCCR